MVTLEDMAVAYIESLKQKIQETEGVVQQNQTYLKQLKDHLLDCQKTIGSNEEPLPELQGNPFNMKSQ